tara:strand:+ start:1216 stop:1545 length:330 start_codon:yes stop_codon:yes gene_type:complete
MSYTTIVRYTKPSIETPNHTPSAEYIALFDSYFNAGKVIQKPTEANGACYVDGKLTGSIEGLTSVWTTIFNSKEDSQTFSNEDVARENNNQRVAHCSEHSISYSLEFDE